MNTPATPVPSRLVARLDAAIAAATDPIERDCLSAERACCLARQGSLDEARAVVAEVQQRYARRPHAEISAWLSLTEGLISHFSDMGPLAHDKLKRSHALSVAANLGDIRALSAAWLAHRDYFKGDMESMARHASEALSVARPDHHSSRSRAALAFAQAYHFAGRMVSALPWYAKVQHHSVADGDDLTRSASMHNMAWLRAANLRQLAFHQSSSVDEASAKYALLSADSTSAYERLIGSKSLDSLTHILRAQILSIEGSSAEALSLYEEHLPSAIDQGIRWLLASILADKAWCVLQVDGSDSGRSRSRAIAESAKDALDQRGQFGDIAPAFSRLAAVYASLGEDSLAQQMRVDAHEAWTGHAKLQEQMISMLDRLAP